MEYYRFKEKNECAYTIDWFTLEFHLLLSLAQWEELEEAVKSLGEKSKDYSSKSGTKLKGKYHHYRAYQIGGLHVQFYEDAPFFDLNFNPNTVHLANDDTAVKCLQWLLSYLRASVALYNVRIRRVDYTFDVPCKYSVSSYTLLPEILFDLLCVSSVFFRILHNFIAQQNSSQHPFDRTAWNIRLSIWIFHACHDLHFSFF